MYESVTCIVTIIYTTVKIAISLTVLMHQPVLYCLFGYISHGHLRWNQGKACLSHILPYGNVSFIPLILTQFLLPLDMLHHVD